MKKLVKESLNEFLISEGNAPINENVVIDWFNTVKGLIQGVFKRAGKFFVALYKDKIMPVFAPINIGILVKSGNLKNVGYIPSSEDIELEPALASLKSGKPMIDRAKQEYLQLAAANKAKGGLKQYESASSKFINSLYEEFIKLEYPVEGVDDVVPASTEFLIKRLMTQVRMPHITPPLIWGAPGIGKTAITKAIIRSLGPGHRVIDVQTSKMAPDDWTLPRIGSKMFIDNQGQKIELAEAQDIPKNWLPVYLPTGDPEEDARRDDIANQGNGGIIFLDELLRASDEVQNTCLKLVNERVIGDHKLGSKWAIVAASNRKTDDPEKQTELGSALADRFEHYNFIPSIDDWIIWAKGASVDPRIIDFIDFNREHFYLFDNERKANTTPRSWEALSATLQATKTFGDIIYTRADIETIMKAKIHPKTVEQLLAFLILIENWSPAQIMMVFTDPKKAPKPNKKGGGWDMVQVKALMGTACSATKDRELKPEELENYIQYFIDLGNAALSSQALWLIVETHPDIHMNIGNRKNDGKNDKYKKAMDMFRAEYGEIKFAKREDVMGTTI